MTWNRREMLGSLGASTLLWAFGCHGKPATPRRPEVSGEIRSWLRDAVARLVAVYPQAHALAVSRRRTTAAIDVLGTGVARVRVDGVVLTVRDKDGIREQVTSELTRDGVAAAVRALVGTSVRTGEISPGTPQRSVPPLKVDPLRLADRDLRDRVETMAARDNRLSSRIVYAAALIDVDDATIWSVTRTSDREQRLVRVRRAATRVAWNGTRPVVSELARGWTGGIDDDDLDTGELEAATEGALELMTPGSFEDGTYALVLDPSTTAAIIDAAARGLLTSTAALRPEVAKRLALGANVAPPALTLADDPTVPAAYGGFAFDDEGEPAARIVLVERGHVVGRLADDHHGRALRPGHVGRIEPAPSHLQLVAGDAKRAAMLDDGFAIEGGLTAVIDPSSDRIVIAASRAREWKKGKRTGRVFADVELVGELAALLASISAMSTETRTIPIRDEVDGLPRWRSIEVPWIRIRGAVRARRLA